MRKFAWIFVVASFSRLSASTVVAADRSAAKEPYDIVIINGRVVDGSGNPWFHADLGIKGGKIVKIGKIAPKRQAGIDAKGMTWLPDYRLAHSHGSAGAGGRQCRKQNPPRRDFDVSVKDPRLRAHGRCLDEYKEEAKRRDGVRCRLDNTGRILPAAQQKRRVDEHRFERIAATSRKVSSASTTVRQLQQEIEKMKQLVARAMEEGAVNLSTAFTGGGYKYADEMIAMAKVVAGYGGYYGSHIGGEGEQINEELDKAIRIAEETAFLCTFTISKSAARIISARSK